MRSFLSRAWPSIVAFILFLLISYLLGATHSRDWSIITYKEPSGLSRFAQEIFLQASIAFLIALAVYEITERVYQKQKTDAQTEASGKILTATAQSVFGVFFDQETINAVINSIFSKPLVRDTFEISYEFEKHDGSDNLVRLKITTEYMLRNASPFAQTATIPLMLSNMMADHPSDPCAEKSKILAVSIDGKPFSPGQIAKLNEQISPAVQVCRLILKEQKLTPTKGVHVYSEVETIKLSNNSEVMQLVMPSKNVQITTHNRTGKDLSINVNGIHPNEFPNGKILSRGGRKVRWEPSGVFLNHNGWVLYWTDLGRPLSG